MKASSFWRCFLLVVAGFGGFSHTRVGFIGFDGDEAAIIVADGTRASPRRAKETNS